MMNFTKNTSNKFLKKVLKTKSFFKTTKTINFISPNIHKVISTIKSWDRSRWRSFPPISRSKRR
jgi:hypothetical protein